MFLFDFHDVLTVSGLCMAHYYLKVFTVSVMRGIIYINLGPKCQFRFNLSLTAHPKFKNPFLKPLFPFLGMYEIPLALVIYYPLHYFTFNVAACLIANNVRNNNILAFILVLLVTYPNKNTDVLLPVFFRAALYPRLGV